MFSLIKNWFKYRNTAVQFDILTARNTPPFSTFLADNGSSGLKLHQSFSLGIYINNCGRLQNAIQLLIPRGFIWNGADIPKKARWLMGSPTDKEWALCSLVHDYIIENNIFPENHYLESKVLLEILKREKHVPTWKEYLAFMGVYLWSIYTAKKSGGEK